MCELVQFKLTIIDYIDLLLQKIPDPLFIVHNRWNCFKKMLLDENITVQEITNYVQNLDISKQQKQQPISNAKYIDNQSVVENNEKQTLKNCFSCKNLSTSPTKAGFFTKNGVSPILTKQNEMMSTSSGQLKFKLIPSEVTTKFPQQAKEKILLSIQTGIRQFERNKQSLISIMENSREIHSPGLEDSISQIQPRIYTRYKSKRDPSRLVKEIGNIS